MEAMTDTLKLRLVAVWMRGWRLCGAFRNTQRRHDRLTEKAACALANSFGKGI